jgi:hypothetical protein
MNTKKDTIQMQEKIKKQCQFCGQLEISNGIFDGTDKEIFQDGNVSHGTCPKCFDIEIKKLEEK